MHTHTHTHTHRLSEMMHPLYHCIYIKKKTCQETAGVLDRVGLCVCVCLCISVCLTVCERDRAADLFLAVSNLHITIMFYNPTFSKSLLCLSLMLF